MKEIIEKINNIAKELEPRKITIMEVCGGHTNTVMKYGIREILPQNIKLISGPGCPVCVTDQKDIDSMIELAMAKIPVATYGDMMHVPGTKMSLNEAVSKGADVTLIYSATDMLKPENKNKVFFAVGFETTTPPTAYLLEHGITIYSSHKVMPPPMKAITNQTKVDGFIGPGHVSCITGTKMFEELNVPIVISGFEKEHIMHSILKLLELIKENKKEVINDYDEVVKEEGNLKAQELIKKHLKLAPARWRGIGELKDSGLEPKDDNLNAKIKYKSILENIESKENKDCICGAILKGEKEPKDCKMFGNKCTPKNPLGACMVSQTEGACGIAYRYLK